MAMGWLKVLAFRIALKTKPPSSIPLTGEDRLKQRNYVSAYSVANDGTVFLVQEESASEFRICYPTKRRNVVVRCRASKKSLIMWSCFFHTYIGRSFFETASPVSFIVQRLFGIYRVRHALSTLSLKFRILKLNGRLKVRQERIDLLTEIVEKRLGDPNFTIDFFHFLNERYGSALFHHSDKENVFSRYRLLLDSFVQNEDLSRTTNGRYEVQPKALITIANHATEDRHHQDLIKQQRLLNVLTLALVCTAIADIAMRILRL